MSLEKLWLIPWWPSTDTRATYFVGIILLYVWIGSIAHVLRRFIRIQKAIYLRFRKVFRIVIAKIGRVETCVINAVVQLRRRIVAKRAIHLMLVAKVTIVILQGCVRYSVRQSRNN